MRLSLILILLLVVISMGFTAHSGYVAGNTADSTDELNGSIAEVRHDLAESKTNMSVSYSEADTSNSPYLQPIERTYFEWVVKPLYGMAKGILEASAVVYEASARYSYNHL